MSLNLIVKLLSHSTEFPFWPLHFTNQHSKSGIYFPTLQDKTSPSTG